MSTASANPDKMVTYLSAVGPQLSKWATEVTDLEEALTSLRSAMRDAADQVSLTVPFYETTFSEARTTQQNLDDFVEEVADAFRSLEKGDLDDYDADTGVMTVDESKLDVDPLDPATHDPARAAEGLQDLLWGFWPYRPHLTYYSLTEAPLLNLDENPDHDLDRQAFLELVTRISLQLGDLGYAADFYAELGARGIRTVTLAFLTIHRGDGPVLVSDPADDARIPSLLSDPLFSALVDGFALATNADTTEMVNLEEMLHWPFRDPRLQEYELGFSDDYYADYGVGRMRMLVDEYTSLRAAQQSAELQLLLLLTAEPDRYDQSFLADAAAALADHRDVDLTDLDSHIEELLGVDLASHRAPDSGDLDLRDDPDIDLAPEALGVTVGPGDSYWTVAEQLLRERYGTGNPTAHQIHTYTLELITYNHPNSRPVFDDSPELQPDGRNPDHIVAGAMIYVRPPSWIGTTVNEVR